MHDISAATDFGPALSAVLMLVLFGFVGLVLYRLIANIRRLRRDAQQADDAVRENTTLVEGAGFVVGTVEFDEDADYAVVVEIRQRGKEYRPKRRNPRRAKPGIKQSWTEVERRCFAQPFWIRHSSGERVRVEPGQDVELVDHLNVTVHDKSHERIRIAELLAGERVVAKGSLQLSAPTRGANYREAGPRTWLLLKSAQSPLQLSSKGLGDDHRRRAAVYFKRAVFGWAPWALLLGLFFTPHIARLSVGQVTAVTIESKREVPSKDEFYVSYLYNGFTRSARVDEADWAELDAGEELAYLELEGWPALGQLGSTSALSWGSVFLAFAVALVYGLYIVLLPVKLSKEWHSVKKFSEGKRGKLPKPKPSTRTILSRVSEERVPKDE
ncbi:MAG: hypothetical protein ACI9KE_003252 [Polyangiales bacterium]